MCGLRGLRGCGGCGLRIQLILLSFMLVLRIGHELSSRASPWRSSLVDSTLEMTIPAARFSSHSFRELRQRTIPCTRRRLSALGLDLTDRRLGKGHRAGSFVFPDCSLKVGGGESGSSDDWRAAMSDI